MAGYIISIIGGKGGVGKSMLAANFAFSYASEQKQRVLLLDFDKQACGDQNFLCGIKPKKNLKDLAEFSGNIDARTIMQFTAVSPQNVSYISMPTNASVADGINIDALGKILKSLAKIFPVIVIDAGNTLNDITLKALEFSTAIFLTVTPDILALNQSKRMYAELISMLFPRDMILMILNQHQNNHPVSLQVAGKSMGKPIFSAIPRDDNSCVSALNQKKPVVLINKNSAYAKGIVDLVRRLVQKNVLKTLSLLQTKVDTTKKLEGKNSGETDKNTLNAWISLKSRIHKGLVEEIDFKADDDSDPKAKIIMKEKTKKVIVDLLNKEDTKSILHSREEMNQIVKEIIDEALGLGPLEDLLADKACSEIMVIAPDKIYFEYAGKLKKSDVIFTNDRQVLNVIERIVAPIGRRIDEKTPYVDARLQDGSRVHAIIPPCSLEGCTITIRKFPDERLTYKDLVKFNSMTQNMADFLKIAVESHRNIVISGGTGSGKTTLINVLGGFIQANERIITCEDSAEINLPQDHVVRLETRPPSLEGDGEIDIRLLVKQTLRMRPDRILVGECRGGETLDMLQAMGTGHDGSMTTVHSNNPRECIGRLETLVQYAGAGLSPKAIREMIANAVHLIVQQSRLDDGSRKVMFVTEIGGMQGDVVILQDIFTYAQKDFDKNGKIIGEFQASGFIPKFIEKMERQGYNVPRGLFSNVSEGGRGAKMSNPQMGRSDNSASGVARKINKNGSKDPVKSMRNPNSSSTPQGNTNNIRSTAKGRNQPSSNPRKIIKPTKG